MTIYTREAQLGDHFTARPLADFVQSRSPQTWDFAPYAAMDKTTLLERLTQQQKWRYHHGIPELKDSESLYVAYVRRIEEMLALIHTGLDELGLISRLASSTVADLAASEGFVTQRLVEWGASEIDCYELSENGLDRFSLLWHYLDFNQRAKARLFSLDLEQVAWANEMPHRYDILFCLGLIYHVESPMLFARNLYEATGEVCIVESDTPSFDSPNRFRGNGVIYLNRDQVTISAGNVRKIIEFRPDREALVDLMLTAGFSEVRVLEDSSEQGFFASGEKTVVICMK